jgi:hypothetical protein
MRAILVFRFARHCKSAPVECSFVAFVPRRVLPQLPGMEAAAARVARMAGVVSFLDVAGFTKLTEKLAAQADGAERLAKIINKLMAQLLNTLPTGDVIK